MARRKKRKSERCYSNPISQLFWGTRNDYTVSLYSPLYAVKCLTHHVECFMASLHHDCFTAAFSECFMKLNQTNQTEYFQTPTDKISVFCMCIFGLFCILYLLHFPFHTCSSSSHLSLSIFFIFQFTTSQSYCCLGMAGWGVGGGERRIRTGMPPHPFTINPISWE